MNRQIMNLQIKSSLLNSASIIILSLALSGCGSYLKSSSEKVDSQDDFSTQIQPDSSSSPAVLSLIKKARVNAINGELDKATLRLERAIRIEPANPTVWHYMAKLFLQQENYKQAAGYAAKSTNLARDNIKLVIDNWRIIAHARFRLGNKKGAQQAQDTINKLQQ